MVAPNGPASVNGTNGNGRRSNGRASTPPASTRVAIYTRQSVADDLEFGSIDAQREAVEAYVMSQRGEGWQALPERYDDGGFSGATTERPAFQRLLADIEAGRVDIVGVYKIDRISRSLPDFVRFTEKLDRLGVGFVSITQSFDTRTSMGRLTLNIVASFAQFERETISERTRDKVLATRRKGMWTGGPVPLGYDVVDKHLVVNEAEADLVRRILETYLQHGSLGATLVELRREGIGTKSWTTQAGKAHRSRAFCKSTLAKLLTNPTYVGRMRCGKDVVDARHEAIVERATFDAVQRLLREHRRDPGEAKNSHGALLKGVLRCARCDSAMSHVFTRRHGRIYRYYACQTQQQRGADACPGSRAAAGDIEGFVVQRIAEIGKDPEILRLTLARAREQLVARAPELEAESKRIGQEAGRLGAERRNLLAAVGEGGGARSELLARLAEVDERLAAIAARREALAAELAGIEGTAIDEDDLRIALADFEPVWDELFTAERVRIVRLLVEEVRFDADRSEVAITFRPGGVQALAAEARVRR